MDKVKNAVALIPAFLFFYYGIETIYHSMHDFLWPTAEQIVQGGSAVIPIIVIIIIKND